MSGNVVVLDNGSGYIKVGWAGDVCPRLVVPNVIAKTIHSSGGKEVAGAAIMELHKYFSLCPFKRGLLADVALQVSIWKQSFLEAQGLSKSSNHVWTWSSDLLVNKCLMLSLPFNAPSSNIKALMEVVFRSTPFGSVCFWDSSVYAWYAYKHMLPADEIDVFPMYGQVKFPLKYTKFTEDKVNTPVPLNILWPQKLVDTYRHKTMPVTENDSHPYMHPDNMNPLSLIVDIGHSGTNIVAMLGSTPIYELSRRLAVGGVHIAAYMAQISEIRHFDINNNGLVQRMLAEDCIYISPSHDEAHSIIKTNKEKLRCKRGVGIPARARWKEDSLYKAVIMPRAKYPTTYGMYRSCRRNPLRHHELCEKGRTKVKCTLQATLAHDLEEETDANDLEIFHSTSADRIPLGEVLFVPDTLPYELRKASILPSIADTDCHLVGLSGGIAEILLHDKSKLVHLSSRIVLTGGCSGVEGLPERLYHDLRSLLPESAPINIYTCTNGAMQQHLNWIGASMVAKTYPQIIEKMAILREEYFSMGPERCLLKYHQSKAYIDSIFKKIN